MSSKNIAKGFFVTGTDTGIGKTTATSVLIKQLQTLGYSAIGCKPVAAGSVVTNKGVRHQDALIYQNINSISLDYQKINPVLFQQPISPNIAAETEEKEINVQFLYEQFEEVFSINCHYIFVEGVGGWRVPINDQSTMADFARKINYPVIFIVGIKLGCLNHALLTWEALIKDNMNVAGWIANIIEPDTLEIHNNIATLKKWIKAPFIGEIAYKGADSSTTYELDLSAII